MSKLDPQTAWSHVKALWPLADFLRKDEQGVLIRFSDASKIWESRYHIGIDIDWGDINQWPPKEEWRDARMPEDWGKEARFKDHKADGWETCRLCGYSVNDKQYLDADGCPWTYCQVRVTEPEQKPKDWANTEERRLLKEAAELCKDLWDGYEDYDDDLAKQFVEWNDKYKAMILRICDEEFEEAKSRVVDSEEDAFVVSAYEQVAKYHKEVADTQPPRETAWRSMEDAPKDRKIKLIMGGECLIGGRNAIDTLWITRDPDTRSNEWDRANQPTAWQPIQEPLP